MRTQTGPPPHAVKQGTPAGAKPAPLPLAGAAAHGAGVPLTPRPRRRRGRLWIIVGVVALLALVVGVWAWRSRAAATAATAKKGEEAPVVRALIEKSVTSSGKVVPNLDVEIKCRASGEVVKLPFHVSDHVKRGDLLCQLDTRDEELAVRLAEATVAQAEAKVEQAKANLRTAELNLQTTRRKTESALVSARIKAANLRAKADRQKELIEQKLSSPEERETAETEAAAAAADERAAEVAVEELKQQEIQLEFKRQDVKTAEAALQADRITLDQQKQQLAYATVTAPMDGVVSSLTVQEGQIIASGLNAVNGGTTILTLADLSQIFVIASVDESDIGGIRVGQKARVTVSSYPGRSFAAKVMRVGVKGANVSNVVTFEVRVEVLDEQKGLLKPEMTGDVTIVEEERPNVLTIPTAAVTRKDRQTLVTLPGGKQQPVTLGLEGAENVEVTAGLKEGDRVVVPEVELPTRWKNED